MAGDTDPLDAEVRRLYFVFVNRGTSRQAPAHVPAWDGGLSASGRRYTSSVWSKIAGCIRQNAADPYEFIAAQFAGLDNAAQRPPNALHGPMAVARWQAFTKAGNKSVADELTRSRIAMQAHALPMLLAGRGEAAAYAYAIGEQVTNCASAIYRYCLATRLGLSAVADFYHDAALLSYACRRDAYDQTWGDFVPDALRVAARQWRVDNS